MTKILVIDTATERGIIAIILETAIVFQAHLPPGLQNSSYILPNLDEGLRRLHISTEDLSLIVVGIGPGSYTGIRIGAIVAKTLSFASSIPLVGICSLDGFIPPTDGDFAVVIDAKIGGVYIQKGKKQGSEITALTTPQVLPLEEAAMLLRDTPLLITPQISPLQQKLAQYSPNNAWQWVECYPSPERLATLASDRFQRADWDPNAPLELLYMRKTQAEIELNKGS